MFVIPVDGELRLGLFQSCHAGELFDLYSRNRARLEAWMPYVSKLHSPDDVRTFIREALERFGTERGAFAGMWLNDTLAGEIGIRIREDRNASIGYVVDQAHEGRGLVTRSVRAIAAYAFRTWSVRRIEIRVSPDNPRSMAVAERAGFIREGLLRQAIEFDGKVQDLIVYSRLAGD